MQALSDVIATIESENNPFAVRYEPHHIPRNFFVQSMQKACGGPAACSAETARMFCMCSFGLYQIMGDGLIDLGLSVSPIIFMQSRQMQDAFFNEFCKKKGILYSVEQLKDDATRYRFATYYNGPGNPKAYADRMAQMMGVSLCA